MKSFDATEFKKYFSDEKYWNKIKKIAKSAGIKVIYASLLLYYVFIDEKTPKSTKLLIAGALGYFVFPLDIIFDTIPIIGFVDDLSVLLFVIAEATVHITEEIQEKAKVQLTKWFGILDESELAFIDEKINGLSNMG